MREDALALGKLRMIDSFGQEMNNLFVNIGKYWRWWLKTGRDFARLRS